MDECLPPLQEPEPYGHKTVSSADYLLGIDLLEQMTTTGCGGAVSKTNQQVAQEARPQLRTEQSAAILSKI